MWFLRAHRSSSKVNTLAGIFILAATTLTSRSYLFFCLKCTICLMPLCSAISCGWLFVYS